MKKALKTAMKTSISEVLETMFFMTSNFDLSLGERWVHDCVGTPEQLACSLDFSGSLSGHLILQMPRELGMSMTENFMGEDKISIQDDHLSGMIKEMMNMVAGNAFSHLNDQEAFQISIPEMIDDAGGLYDTLNPAVDEWIGVETMDGCFAVKILFDA